MQFLAPMMLAGAAAVSVPLILHFFYRARHTPLPWGPMRFLKEAIEQTSRRLKFQEIILLILRCLAIILLALAIARPGSENVSRSSRGDAVDAVFVIDNSYSMGARVGDKEKTRLDHAKEAAIAVIATLPANSSVQVFSCSDRAKLVGPTQKLNMDQARSAIGSIQITSLSSDLLPGLSEALAMAKSGTASAKEIYVFTDMQKEAFQRQEGAVRAKCEEIKAAANLVFIRCGDVSKRLLNVAVEDVTWHTESIPHTGPGVPFVVTLRNYGSDPVKSVNVFLEIDGKPVEKEPRVVDVVEADQTSPVTFTGTLEKAGVSVISVRITESEGLPGDNVFYKTILVRDKVRVLLVNGTPKPENPTGSGDHFIRTALNPAKIQQYYIETETVPANEAGPKDLDGKDIVYLLNAPIRNREVDPIAGMSMEFLGELDKFVKSGGGLVIGCGDNVNGELYDKTLGSGGSKLLPFDLATTRSATETSPFHPAADTVEEASFLGRFRLSPYAQSLQGVSLFRMFGVTEAGASGRVLVRTTSGLPYITSKVVGTGEVILITGSLDESWGNFSSDPGSFQVPLAIFTVTHLTGRKVAGGSVTAGNPLVYYPPPEAGTTFELVYPDKQLPRLKLTAVEGDGKRTVTAPETELAGIYHIVPLGKSPDRTSATFIVNPDIRESKSLATTTDDDLAGWLGFRPSIIQAGAGTDSAVTQLRTRSEWTEYVLVLLLVLLVAETTWAWVCGRSW
ncbi:MAG: BatA domain-containing protein [Planctomycetes bacterium]|nr:BatA domain-containing protein [Planctomycetota bacterium]